MENDPYKLQLDAKTGFARVEEEQAVGASVLQLDAKTGFARVT